MSAFTTSDSDYLLHAYITQRLRMLDVNGDIQVDIVRERAGNWFEIRVVVISSGETVNACRMFNCTDLLDKVTPVYAMDLLSVEMDALCRDIAREQQRKKAARAERQQEQEAAKRAYASMERVYEEQMYYGFTTTNNKLTIEQTAREMLDMGRIYEERDRLLAAQRVDELEWKREYLDRDEPKDPDRFELLDLGPKTKEADDQSDDIERYRQLDLDWP